MTKSIKLNSGKIISMRDEINATKKKYWKIIRTTNLLSKAEIKNGFRTHDIKSLHNQITQLAEKLVLVKGMLCYLNMGIAIFDEEEFKKTNNYSIFQACELKEIIAQLKMIPTLDPKTKSQKGLKAIGKDEVFTSAKIAALIKDLELKANKFDNSMDNFNKNTEIDITTISDKFETELTA
jgi:NDP-sugar pyrophosphorylase family protein